MTDAQIISACMDAETAYLKNHRPTAVRLGKWLVVADKDPRGKTVRWVYEAAKCGVRPIKGNRDEIVQAIREHEPVG